MHLLSNTIWSPRIRHGPNAKWVKGQWAHPQRYPEEHRPLACLLKQTQQKNLKKRETSNKTGVDKEPKNPHFQHVSLLGLTEAQCSSTLHKSQNRGCRLSHFSNGSLLPSCMGRRGLSITKEINTISNTIYSTLGESRPPLNLQFCFLNVLVEEFCSLNTWLSATVNHVLK